MQVITVNELFAGIGAFRKALQRLGIEHKVVGISEIDKWAIASYNAIYGETYNYGDISKVEALRYADLWTYGFPCQDLSTAGKQKGIIRGQTRSGLLYEVERLLQAAIDRGEAPKYLILENVKALVGKKFMPDFERWVSFLADKGYITYWQVLNAKDYGVPQNRERVFAVSIRQDIDRGFEFPDPRPRRFSFYDALEQEVDDKYYLSDKTIEGYEERSKINRGKGNGFAFNPIDRQTDRQTDSAYHNDESREPNGRLLCERIMPTNITNDKSCRCIVASYYKLSDLKFREGERYGATGIIENI